MRPVLRWLFLDIGNVLMNDDPAMAFLYRELYHATCAAGYQVSYRRLLAEREELIRIRGPEHWGILARRYLGVNGQRKLMDACSTKIRADYMACHAVIPGMVDAIRTLATRYRIGVIANQLREVSAALDSIGLGEVIALRGISEIIGIRKPDLAIYRWACEQARCEPCEALMIGDRIDNDIAPARAAGLWTILFRIPHDAKGYVAADEMESLYFASQLRESICRISPAGSEEAPDMTAGSIPELLAAIEEIRIRAESPSEEVPARR